MKRAIMMGAAVAFALGVHAFAPEAAARNKDYIIIGLSGLAYILYIRPFIERKLPKKIGRKKNNDS